MKNQDRPLEKPACRPPLLSLKAKYEFNIDKRTDETNLLLTEGCFWLLLSNPRKAFALISSKVKGRSSSSTSLEASDPESSRN